MILQLVKRNLRLYFRDKTSVFFSMLGVIIIIALYLLFLGNLIAGSVESVAGDSARFLMDSWIMGGVVSVASITTCLGAFGIIVDDNVKKIIRDFKVSPIKRWELTLSYIISGFLVGMIMTILTFVLAELYIFVNGGKILTFEEVLQMLGLITLSVASSSSMVFFLVSMIKSQNAFGTASTLLGTIIGFLTGVYIPVGQLPAAVQTVIKIFPVSHAAVLMRQVMMNHAVDLTYLPDEIKTYLGVQFQVGGHTMTDLASILVLLGTMVLFYGLSLIFVANKKEKE